MKIDLKSENKLYIIHKNEIKKLKNGKEINKNTFISLIET